MSQSAFASKFTIDLLNATIYPVSTQVLPPRAMADIAVIFPKHHWLRTLELKDCREHFVISSMIVGKNLEIWPMEYRLKPLVEIPQSIRLTQVMVFSDERITIRVHNLDNSPHQFRAVVTAFDTISAKNALMKRA